jgi:hypothetical protein
VFLPGASLVGLDYLNIHQQVAPLATSVLYDRGGTGWSDPAGLPRTAEAVATELRDLALAASVSRGEHRALPDARHSTVTTDRADAVVQAITDLLDLT